MKDKNLAKEALELINELEQHGGSYVGNLDSAREYIKRTGNVSPSFVESLKEQIIEVNPEYFINKK